MMKASDWLLDNFDKCTCGTNTSHHKFAPVQDHKNCSRKWCHYQRTFIQATSTIKNVWQGICLRLKRFPFQGGITLQSSGVGNSPTVTQATLSTVIPQSIFSSSTSLQNGNTLATGELNQDTYFDVIIKCLPG